MASYLNKYPHLQANIKQVQALINQRVVVANPQITQAVQALNAAGGKFLRPAFFFLFTEFGPGVKDHTQKEKLLKVAASLEILHIATLIHDDIIDDSPLRRSQVTIQAKFGKDVAVYTGDLLFTIFFELILETMQASDFMAINAQAMKKILMGELDQMQLYYKQDQTIDDYLQAIAGKTAALFALAAQEGAYFGGADNHVVALAETIGYKIGMAFQILDDILDYSASAETFTKPVLEDLAQGIYSLPLLIAIDQHPDYFGPLLSKKQTMTQADMEAVAKGVVDYGGLDGARQMARSYTQEALAAIDSLPDNKSKQTLKQLTQYLLKRKL